MTQPVVYLVESRDDASLRVIEDLPEAADEPIAHGTTSTPGDVGRFHGDDFTEPARPDAGGRHAYSVFGGNFPQG